jgi:hypothetical protein
MKRTLMMLVHNCVAHPVAGVLWLVGADALGDWLHDVTVPRDAREVQP